MFPKMSFQVSSRTSRVPWGVFCFVCLWLPPRGKPKRPHERRVSEFPFLDAHEHDSRHRSLDESLLGPKMPPFGFAFGFRVKSKRARPRPPSPLFECGRFPCHQIYNPWSYTSQVPGQNDFSKRVPHFHAPIIPFCETKGVHSMSTLSLSRCFSCHRAWACHGDGKSGSPKGIPMFRHRWIGSGQHIEQNKVLVLPDICSNF